MLEQMELSVAIAPSLSGCCGRSAVALAEAKSPRPRRVRENSILKLIQYENKNAKEREKRGRKNDKSLESLSCRSAWAAPR
jgi:hypothetical protein